MTQYERKRNEHTFDSDNLAGQKHGGEGALTRLNDGRPFVGLALETYHSILERWGYTDSELASHGLVGDIVRETARQQTVTELLHAATLGAAELGDLEKWDRFVKRWGWRSDKSLAAMRELAKLQAEDKTLDYEAILQDSTDTSQTHQD